MFFEYAFRASKFGKRRSFFDPLEATIDWCRAAKTMILKPGEKLHVIHRRNFEREAHRHFVGVVEGYEAGVARVTGHVYTVDTAKASFFRRPEKRIRILAISSGDLLVNVLPPDVDLDKVVYKLEKKSVRVTDGSDWFLDISEFAWR